MYLPQSGNKAGSCHLRLLPTPVAQNTPAKLVFSLPKFPHIARLHCNVHWLLLAAQIRFNTGTFQDIVKASNTVCYCQSATTYQSHGCLLSWLHNGETSFPLTSGQQKQKQQQLFQIVSTCERPWFVCSRLLQKKSGATYQTPVSLKIKSTTEDIPIF